MENIISLLNADDPFLLFFGSFYMVLGFSFVFAKEQWEEFMGLFIKHDSLSLFLGVLILPISLSIVLFYNIWDPIGSTVLMVLGYMGIIKAFLLLLRPSVLQGMLSKRFVQKWMWLDGVSGVALGASMLFL